MIALYWTSTKINTVLRLFQISQITNLSANLVSPVPWHCWSIRKFCRFILYFCWPNTIFFSYNPLLNNTLVVLLQTLLLKIYVLLNNHVSLLKGQGPNPFFTKRHSRGLHGCNDHAILCDGGRWHAIDALLGFMG